jgi:hypothetical protein
MSNTRESREMLFATVMRDSWVCGCGGAGTRNSLGSIKKDTLRRSPGIFNDRGHRKCVILRKARRPTRWTRESWAGGGRGLEYRAPTIKIGKEGKKWRPSGPED